MHSSRYCIAAGSIRRRKYSPFTEYRSVLIVWIFFWQVRCLKPGHGRLERSDVRVCALEIVHCHVAIHHAYLSF